MRLERHALVFWQYIWHARRRFDRDRLFPARLAGRMCFRRNSDFVWRDFPWLELASKKGATMSPYYYVLIGATVVFIAILFAWRKGWID